MSSAAVVFEISVLQRTWI